jgi:hypothetical protein
MILCPEHNNLTLKQAARIARIGFLKTTLCLSRLIQGTLVAWQLNRTANRLSGTASLFIITGEVRALSTGSGVELLSMLDVSSSSLVISGKWLTLYRHN